MNNYEFSTVLDQANSYLEYYQDEQINKEWLSKLLNLKSLENIAYDKEHAYIGQTQIEITKISDLINANKEIAEQRNNLKEIKSDIELVKKYRNEIEEEQKNTTTETKVDTAEIVKILDKYQIKISEPKYVASQEDEKDEETPIEKEEEKPEEGTVENKEESSEEKKEKKQRIFQKEITQLNKKKSAIKRKIEETEHQRFVDECLKPRGFADGLSEVYALINPVDESDLVENFNPNSMTYHVSLQTPSMAYTECRYFFEEFEDGSQPWWYENYRPYYYELWIEIDNNSDSKDEWEELCQFCQKNGFIKAHIYQEDIEDRETKSYLGTLRFGGSETFEEEVRFVPSAWVNQITIDNNDTVRYYSIKSDLDKGNKVSPKDQIFHDRYLLKKGLIKKILDRTIAENEVELKNNKSELRDVDTYLDARFKHFCNSSKPFDIKTEILNVGAANCIHFDVGTSLSFMFDVGIPYEKYKESGSHNSIDNTDYLSKDKGNIRGSIGSISKYSPDFIILSHFHYDHVLGIAHLSDKAINNSVWITPMIDDEVKDLTCLRLVLFKAKQKKLIVIGTQPGECIYDGLFFKLFRGKGQGDLNDSSLMLIIKNKKRALFAADCRYGSWPDAAHGFSPNALKSIDYLVVPHHGSAYKVVYDVLNQFKNDCEAVICCGKGSYDHPRPEHLHELNSRFKSDNIYLTGGTLKSTKDNKYEYDYEDPKGNKVLEYVMIKKDTIEFTL